MSPVNLTKSIGRNLSLSSDAIDELRNELEEQKGKAPKNTEAVEARLRAIEGEIDSLSEKMLAYKLKRLAASKMLAQVSELSQSEQKVEEESPQKSKGSANTPVPASPSKNRSQKLVMAKKKTTSKQSYDSSTFQCKSDLDMCLLDATGALERALCYALFIRCAVKG